MAYAKLTGALLVRKDADAPTAEIVSVPRFAASAAARPNPGQGRVDKRLVEDLKALNLPTFVGAYDKLARECAIEGLDHSQFLLRLAELELEERKRQIAERRIKAARFPAMKELDRFDFTAVPSLDERQLWELARCEFVADRENIIIIGNSGTGKTHIALGLGVAACREGLSVGFFTAAALVNQLLETRYQWRLLRLQKRLAAYNLLLIDELGYVPLPAAGAELLFEVLSQRHERGSTIITSHLQPAAWAPVFGTAQLTTTVVDRLTHRAHILDTYGESYRLKTH